MKVSKSIILNARVLKKLKKLSLVSFLTMSLLLAACGSKEASKEVTADAPPAAQTASSAAEELPPVAEPVEPADSVAGEVSEEEYYSQDVTITNSTGVSILEMYVSSSDSDDWGEDILDGEVFADGESGDFTPNVLGTADDTWDILIVDEDGDEVTFKGINFSAATDLDLNWGEDGFSPTVDIKNAGDDEYFNQNLDISNDTGVAILELYISPSADDMWGEDMLGDDIFPTGETLTFETELVGTIDDTWDIKIIDEDQDEVIFEGISFSSSTHLSLNWGDDGATPTVDMY